VIARRGWRNGALGALLSAAVAGGSPQVVAAPPPDGGGPAQVDPHEKAMQEVKALLDQLKALHAKGRIPEATAVAVRVLSESEKRLGLNHPYTVAALLSLAELYKSQDQPAKAEPLYERALAVWEQEVGSDDSGIMPALDGLGAIHFARGRYTRAQPLLARALAYREKALGPDHPETLTTLNNLGLLLSQSGQYLEAEPVLTRALATAEKILGPAHPDIAVSLNNLGELLAMQGQYARAEPLLARALACREKALGPEHRQTAASLSALARLYGAQGRYTMALPLHTRAIAIAEKALGPDHPDTAALLTNLATLHATQGQFAQAERLQTRAVAIVEKALGPDHPNTASALDNLAVLSFQQGHHARAEPLYTRALAIREKTLGGGHPDVANSLNNLAELYRTAGQDSRAEPLYRRALAIREKTLGPDHPDTATCLGNLAGLYHSQGQYAKAEPLHTRALAIREKTQGPEHPRTAAALNGLAMLYFLQGQLSRAEPLYTRVLAIAEKTLGPDHPDTATSLGNLAWVYVGQGQYGRAEPLAVRALAITEKALGPEHPGTAASLNNLAAIHQAQRRYAKAEALYTRALAITDKALGPDHPQVAQFAFSQAMSRAVAGQPAGALALFERAALINEHTLARELPAQSEPARLAFVQTLGRDADAIIAWSLTLGADDVGARARRLALQTLMQRKGRVLDVGRQTLDVLRTRATEADREKLARLQETRSLLATLTFSSPPRGQSLESLRRRRQELTATADALESDLGRRFAELRQESTSVTLPAVQERLGAGQALVEIAAYRPWSATAPLEARRQAPEHYVAFVLHAQGEPRAVDLGERGPIDALAARWLAQLRGRDREAAARGRELHQRLMVPLQAALGGVRDLWLSPDGALNAVPWAALVDEGGRPLISSHRLTYLTSARDLLRIGGGEEARGPVLVMGAPSYDGGGAVRKAVATALESAPLRPRAADGLHFTPLPGTRTEARQVAALYPHVKPYLGADAREAVLKSAHQPRLVHLATHGFRLEPTLAPLPPVESARGATPLLPPAGRTGPVENPLLLSGLALADANGAGKGPDDGLLFALEVSALDLRGTKLVVLSACQSGQGASVSGEGLYGLRRALVLAGSQSQVLSLWDVDDDATARFMVALHRKLAEGVSRADALRDVQRDFLADPRTAQPFFWAAFFLQGDPSSFDGKPPAPLGP
jgi:CHAT domain-containing protein/Tfp pilus assembly protein PilF